MLQRVPLLCRNPNLRKNASVAVISPYKAQVKLLREAFKTALGEEMARLVDVNTIDGFQGREKDVCFFSCVSTVRVLNLRCAIHKSAPCKTLNVVCAFADREVMHDL
eukprot:scaffold44044_cov20-Tisochrysis_lutea.AAC.1